MNLIKLSHASLAIVLSQSAAANISISFLEGAPKDRFVITNVGQCNLESLVLKIDLSSTAGKLIFDTTEQGGGVEVFQPFEASEGNIALLDAADVKDGQTSIDLAIAALAPNASVSFTIDVDDTMVQSELGQIRVSKSEIQGGMVAIGGPGLTTSNATFGDDAKATIALASC